MKLKLIRTKKAATKDMFTNTYNKHYGELYIQKALEEHKHGVIAIFDINNLKLINDTQGHKQGDYVIKEFVRILKSNFRSDDIIVRTGGDEFLLFAMNIPIAIFKHRIEKSRIQFSEISDYGFAVGYYEIRYDNNKTLKEIIENIDKQMYENKKEIKSRKEW